VPDPGTPAVRRRADITGLQASLLRTADLVSVLVGSFVATQCVLEVRSVGGLSETQSLSGAVNQHRHCSIIGTSR
jgi:hypothetical protein